MAKAKKKKAAPAKKATVKKSKAPAVKKAKAKPQVKAKQKPASVIDWHDFLTPLDDRLIVETASDERITAGGLYIPDTVADLSGNFKGRVLIAGRGHRDEKGRLRPMDVKTGDTVLFAEYSGSKLELLGKEVRILRESEILGIVDKR
ncbi:MAG: hypothetical protein ACAH59_08985 [Pseudobdellovibrionaceae bacterium]